MTTTTTAVGRDRYPAAGAWEIDPAHTTVEFVARHLMVSKVRGRFDSFTGTIEIGEDVVDSVIEVDLDVTSLTTGSPDRDAHLASADFFEAGDHPPSTSQARDRAGRCRLARQRPLDRDRSAHHPGRHQADHARPRVPRLRPGPLGQHQGRLLAAGEVDREDWGLTWNVALEGGGVLVSKKVKLEIETQIKQSVV